MIDRSGLGRQFAWLALLVTIVSGPGCIPGLPGAPIGDNVPVPASTFAGAPLFPDATTTTINFTGSLPRGAVQVWSLGALKAGDRINVSVAATVGSQLDPTVAIFDSSENLFTFNDDVNLNGGRLDSAIDEFVRVDSDPFYLAIAPSFFDNSSGGYTASVRITTGGMVPEIRGQTVFLNFDGGVASVNGVGSFNLDPFDAADIDPAYAGQTDSIRRRIIDVVDENFAGINITILNSVDNAVPDAPFSEIYFGEFNDRAFGVSESVDHWNQNRADKSIIFIERFDDPFGSKPSNEGIAVAIGNVATHEIGHLLGLEHTADITEIMDTTGTASTLLADQAFARAVLDDSVFPIGFQDAMQLLLMLLGPA